MDIFFKFLETTGFASMTLGNAVMILIGIVFITLAIRKDYEPLLLVPIGMGAIVGNIPVIDGMSLSVYDQGSVLSYLYFGVSQGVYPPLIFLGIGAMTDFSTMLSNPKLVLLGAAAQIGVFLTFLGAIWLGFTLKESGAIGIIGGADGPTAIFLAAKLAPPLLGAIAIAAYSYMALGSGDPAADHATADDSRRTADSDVAAAKGLQAGEDVLPDRCLPDLDPDRSRCDRAAGHAVLWKSTEGESGHRATGTDRAVRDDRHRYDSARVRRRC